MIKNLYKIQVPATSANLGSGFDTLGIAFNIYNTFYIGETDHEGELIIEGVPDEFCNENNLIYQAMDKLFKKYNYTPKGIYIKEENEVPFAKGLGSSATCIVAGLVGANLIMETELNKIELLQIATEMEGHPDNVAPALFGNLTASMQSDNQTVSIVKKVNPIYKFICCIPNFELPTEKARNLLPKEYNIKDIVYNISHSIFTFESFNTGEIVTLEEALGDRLHEQYRASLIPGFEKIVELKEHYPLIGGYLSGAGPSIILVSLISKRHLVDELNEYFKENLPNWSVIEVKPDESGCLWRKINSPSM